MRVPLRKQIALEPDPPEPPPPNVGPPPKKLPVVGGCAGLETALAGAAVACEAPEIGEDDALDAEVGRH